MNNLKKRKKKKNLINYQKNQKIKIRKIKEKKYLKIKLKKRIHQSMKIQNQKVVIKKINIIEIKRKQEITLQLVEIK